MPEVMSNLHVWPWRAKNLNLEVHGMWGGQIAVQFFGLPWSSSDTDTNRSPAERLGSPVLEPS